MELKWAQHPWYHNPESSNRTFMELKFNTLSNIRTSIIVLIVPLWN